MDVLSTMITAIIMVLLFIYISMESNRRKQKRNDLEANYNIKVSRTFYLITSILLIIFYLAYYFEAYPNSSPFSMFMISLILLIFPFISYSLAKKKIIVRDNEIIVYKTFKKITIPLSDITQIIDNAITTKIYSNSKKTLTIDRRLYENIRQILNKIKEKINE
mgnify:FL=1